MTSPSTVPASVRRWAARVLDVRPDAVRIAPAAGGQTRTRGAACWQLADVFGFLPDPTHHVGRLLRRGDPEAPADALVPRLERLVGTTMAVG